MNSRALIVIPILAVLAIVWQGNVKVTAAPPYPIQIVIVVPSSHPSLMTASEALAMLEVMTKEVQDWTIRETGMTFNYEFVVLHVPETVRQLNVDPNSGIQHLQDPCGYGVHVSKVVQVVQREEAAAGMVPWIVEWPQTRQWIVVIGGGGTVGGTFSQHSDPNQHWGRMVYGDYDMLAASGRAVPCDPQWYGLKSYGHEAYHAFNVTIHFPEYSTFTGDHLTIEQKAELLKHNPNHLYPVAAPPTPTATVTLTPTATQTPVPTATMIPTPALTPTPKPGRCPSGWAKKGWC